MSAAEAQFRQEMPPKGGYNSINFKRVPAKTFFNGKTCVNWIWCYVINCYVIHNLAIFILGFTLFGGYLAVTGAAAYLFYLNCKSVHRRELEMKCANLAIYPMLLAERDRAFLKQLRKNRDEEDDLMKNVEGWKTGTWYGEPIYKTLPPDTLTVPQYQEYYVHASFNDFIKRPNVTLMSWSNLIIVSLYLVPFDRVLTFKYVFVN